MNLDQRLQQSDGLEIGGHRPELGYLVLNADPRRNPDIVAEVPPLPQEIDGKKWRVIRMIHTLEHLSHGDALKLMRDCRLRLRPGGQVVIEVPNLEYICKVVLGQIEIPDPRKRAQCGVHGIFGNDSVSPGCLGFHRWGYTPASLRELLIEAGFADADICVRPAKYHVPARDFRMVATLPATLESLKVVGLMSLGTSTSGIMAPQWQRCLASLMDHCSAVYLRIDTGARGLDMLDEARTICGAKLQGVLKSEVPWDLWRWREEMIRMLDDVRPDIVLTPDCDEEFGDGLRDDLRRLMASANHALMFHYQAPMPTEDGVVINEQFPRLAHMKAFKWSPGLTYRRYQTCAQVTQYSRRDCKMAAKSRIQHYCYFTEAARAARGFVPSKSQHRLVILYDMPGGAQQFRARALAKHAPEDFSVRITQMQSWCLRKPVPKVILCIDQKKIAKLRSDLDRRKLSPVLVASHNTAFENSRGRLREILQVADCTIITHRAAWDAAGQPGGAAWITHGVDRDFFRCIVPPRQRPFKVLWTARRMHHRIRGFRDIIRPLALALDELHIEHDFRLTTDGGTKYLSPEAMVNWYNSGAVYVVASRTEATPNVAIEAAACGCVVISSPVGCMPELIDHGVNGELVERNVAAFVAAILRCRSRYVEMTEAMQRTVEASWGWDHRASQYYDLFRALLRQKESA